MSPGYVVQRGSVDVAQQRGRFAGRQVEQGRILDLVQAISVARAGAYGQGVKCLKVP